MRYNQRLKKFSCLPFSYVVRMGSVDFAFLHPCGFRLLHDHLWSKNEILRTPLNWDSWYRFPLIFLASRATQRTHLLSVEMTAAKFGFQCKYCRLGASSPMERCRSHIRIFLVPWSNALSQRFVFPRVICSPEHWALVLCVPPSPPYS